jgi:hypothetical protein
LAERVDFPSPPRKNRLIFPRTDSAGRREPSTLLLMRKQNDERTRWQIFPDSVISVCVRGATHAKMMKAARKFVGFMNFVGSIFFNYSRPGRPSRHQSIFGLSTASIRRCTVCVETCNNPRHHIVPLPGTSRGVYQSPNGLRV